MDDALQTAYRSVFEAVAGLIREPWRKIWWRTLMSSDPLHYYYYLPRTSREPVYWEDADRRMGMTAADRTVEMEAAAAAVHHLWRTWTEANRGRSPWTIATLVLTPDGVIHATYHHRHRHQIDPVEEQFDWETATFGRVYVPYRMARLRRGVRSRWRRSRHAGRWQPTDTGYWERLPQTEAVYRGARRNRLPAPQAAMIVIQKNESDPQGGHEGGAE